jgi:hypothetical protein
MYDMERSIVKVKVKAQSDLLLKTKSDILLEAKQVAASIKAYSIPSDGFTCFLALEDNFNQVKNILFETESTLGLWSECRDEFHCLNDRIEDLKHRHMSRSDGNQGNSFYQMICSLLIDLISDLINWIYKVIKVHIVPALTNMANSVISVFDRDSKIKRIKQEAVEIILDAVIWFFRKFLNFLKPSCVILLSP